MAYMEVIMGPMFSAKSKLLVTRAERAEIAGKKILALKPASDTRSHAYITSRTLRSDGTSEMMNSLKAQNVSNEHELKHLLSQRFDVLLVDEAQFFPLDATGDQLGFFGRSIRSLMYRRRGNDLRIYISGLDMTYEGLPFNGMPGLCALANTVTKVTAICRCGEDAIFSQRLTTETDQVVVGDGEKYEPRCRKCFSFPL